MENSAQSLKVVCSFRTLCKIVVIKIGGKTRFEDLLKQFSIPFALVGYEVIITNSRYALVGYFITSYPTRARGIIVIYREGFFHLVAEYKFERNCGCHVMKDSFVSMQCAKDNLVNKKHRNKYLKHDYLKFYSREQLTSAGKDSFFPFCWRRSFHSVTFRRYSVLSQLLFYI